MKQLLLNNILKVGYQSFYIHVGIYIKDILVSHVILSMMPKAKSRVRKKMSKLYLQNEDMLEYVYRLHMNEGVILTKTSYYTCIDNEDNEERDVQILIFH